MVSEALTLDLHTIFCRIGDRFFEMVNSKFLSHEAIVSLCRELIQSEAADEAESLTQAWAEGSETGFADPL